MLTNRSVPVDTVLPHVSYNDLPRALEWLAATFGFVEHYRYGDPLSGVQVHLGNAWLMLNAARSDRKSPAQLGYGTQMLTIFVDNVETHFAHSRNAGARIVEGLHETIYGEMQYGVEDLEGHRWVFSRHAHDVDPAEWGARVLNPL